MVIDENRLKSSSLSRYEKFLPSSRSLPCEILERRNLMAQGGLAEVTSNPSLSDGIDYRCVNSTNVEMQLHDLTFKADSSTSSGRSRMVAEKLANLTGFPILRANEKARAFPGPMG